ncbi:NADPH-dependent F420 reductase [Ralstonia pseudosolanacearum]|uniref:NADPH-dependent F420 reductase n=1 Tax=Ralstonia pseudosolanacearum TaxID=1310165 RepID=UPI001E64576B|nr:NAD(P)-binding domain-containing protein [Ralstonia pseudosolanacearum]
MKIGIIGTGNIGGALARKLSAAGHDVRVANSSGTEGVRAFAHGIGAEPTDVHGAVAGADVVILAILLPAMRALPTNLFAGVPIETTIIDTSNYYPGLRDSRILEIDNGLAESVWVARQIGRPVIKAFNNALAYTLAELGKPRGASNALPLPWRETMWGPSKQRWGWSIKWGSIQSTQAHCRTPGGSSRQRQLTVATTRPRRCARRSLPQSPEFPPRSGTSCQSTSRSWGRTQVMLMS